MFIPTLRRHLIYTLVSLSVLFVPNLLLAQEGTSPEAPGIEPAENDVYYGIGLSASLLSGAGFSGRAIFDNGLGLQLTTFVLAVSSWTHFNAGLEVQYTFTQGSAGRLYGMGGFGYYLSTRSDTTKPGNRVADPVRLGLGVGGDLYTVGNLAIDGSFAFHWFTSTGKVLPLPSIGFHYYFR